MQKKKKKNPQNSVKERENKPNHNYESPTNPNQTLTRKIEIQKEREIELEKRETVLTEVATVAIDEVTTVATIVEQFCYGFTMGLCHASWEGVAFVGFGLGS